MPNKICKKLLVISLMGLSSICFCHGNHTEDTADRKEITIPTLTLTADLRPSISAAGDSFFLDNEMNLQYQSNNNLFLSYIQRFKLDLNNTNSEEEDFGPDFHEHEDGFFQVNYFGLTSYSGVTFGYEGRLYAPTNREKNNRGFITALGNFLKVKIPVFESFAINLTEGPVFHAYSQGEFEGATGLVTNPVIENRLTASLDFVLVSERLRISIPFFWHEFYHYSSRNDAMFKGGWTHALWISPEIIWKLDETTQLGLSYHSENLFADYTYKISSGGLNGGVFQAVYQLNF